MRDQDPERLLRCADTARRWLDLSPLFLDTETTGLGNDDEIVQVAIIDRDGTPLLDTLVKPRKPIPPDATAIHGIVDEHVQAAPTGAEVLAQVRGLVNGRLVCIYNADFDARLLRQTARAWGASAPWLDSRCVMKLHAEFAGHWNYRRNGWRLWRLEHAVKRCGLGEFSPHAALDDARMTARLLEHIASPSPSSRDSARR